MDIFAKFIFHMMLRDEIETETTRRSYLWATNTLENVSDLSEPLFAPLDALQCANTNDKQDTVCGNRGCSACKLVSYCSKECQVMHWSTHKADCKNPMRSSDWLPIWLRECRAPSFILNDHISPEEEFARRWEDTQTLGIALWGDTPAFDILNLPRNENDNNMDLNLAFTASGDLRHVIMTVNCLPSDYSGHLNFLINDHSPQVVSRNIVLLLILATIPDEILAADVALHFWYSLWMPREYKDRIDVIIAELLYSTIDGNSLYTTRLFEAHGSLHFHDIEALIGHLHHIGRPTTDPDEFQATYDAVRQGFSRRDFRDRMYLGLRPSHRVAFEKYRHLGIVLPFGASHSHFNEPNRSLFSFGGQWLQSDHADPLEGWDAKDVIAAGKAHGALREDIYGCFYFYLSNQLRTFARRIRTSHISLVVTNTDAISLSASINSGCLVGCSLSSSIKFHRIHVSNIVDANYAGLRTVLQHWAPFLAEAKTSILVAYFMNWVVLQDDGRVAGLAANQVKEILRRSMKDSDMMTEPSNYGRTGMQAIKDCQAMAFKMPLLDVYYDNSKPFLAYLKKQGLDELLKINKLSLRKKHTIVPHRLQTPVDAKPDTLPQFSDADGKYYYVHVSSSSALERYVEFSRI